MYCMQTHLASNRQPSDLTDDALVQQARIGDPAAFELLVDRYSPLLFSLTSRLLRDEYLAHDVLQHTFLQLYRSLPTLRMGGTLKAWLCQVAHHRCIDELRRKQPIFFSELASSSDEDECSFLPPLPDSDLLPEEQAERHELRQQLLEAINMLPPHFRTIVLLRYTTHLSFREIGQALSIPEATAKTYFYRARKPLRTLLEPECANERGTQKCRAM
jgi:RNA polymerase sigma factor (sigma-70 family)